MKHVVLMSIPGLRPGDVQHMPHLKRLTEQGSQCSLTASFPAVTWPVQANMLTGKPPAEHGVIANGFFWRETREVEMWTAWNEKIQQPQIWDRLHSASPSHSSAVWFPMLSKGCGADFICMPAPIHNPDGSESLWCYTKPREYYGELLERLGHFPLMNFWGPLANIKATDWIANSGVLAAQKYSPEFFYFYLPHLDYAAQKAGPDSPQAQTAVAELDATIGRLLEGLRQAWPQDDVVYLAASEYVITPVDHVSYPNRVLREAGYLSVRPENEGQGELLDLEASRAWALVDHQFSHVFVTDDRDVGPVADALRRCEGMEEVLVGDERRRYQMDHPRSGEIIAISRPNSWQAYYWWLDNARAPSFARTVDIHRKPGYDPVELHLDFATRSTPLDATLIRGSHGAPVRADAQRGTLICSLPGTLPAAGLRDTDVCELVLGQWK